MAGAVVLTATTAACGGSGGGGGDRGPASKAPEETPKESAAQAAGPLDRAGAKRALIGEADVGFGWKIAPKDDVEDQSKDKKDDDSSVTSDDAECQAAYQGTKEDDLGAAPPKTAAWWGATKGDAYSDEASRSVFHMVFPLKDAQRAEDLTAKWKQYAEACNLKELKEDDMDRTLAITKLSTPSYGDDSSAVRMESSDGMSTIDTLLVRKGANLSYLTISTFSINDDANVEPDDKLTEKLLKSAAERLDAAVR
ncbi:MULTISPECIES: hypothetical protein [unclassified Streptomyces]|uniref:hypothetical protein n=1 Tax=unclassified Streptomyces TaxID=2593676 RepID=UPI00278C4862|nr:MULTISPECIES: hypothetical protein [unclassified Streptomyces]